MRTATVVETAVKWMVTGWGLWGRYSQLHGDGMQPDKNYWGCTGNGTDFHYRDFPQFTIHVLTRHLEID